MLDFLASELASLNNLRREPLPEQSPIESLIPVVQDKKAKEPEK
jgi:hypothetical protein